MANSSPSNPTVSQIGDSIASLVERVAGSDTTKDAVALRVLGALHDFLRALGDIDFDPSTVAKKSYYVVTIGRDVGVFDDPQVARSLIVSVSDHGLSVHAQACITGISDARSPKYKTYEEADAVYRAALASGSVKKINDKQVVVVTE